MKTGMRTRFNTQDPKMHNEDTVTAESRWKA